MAFPSNNNTDINSELFANFVADAQYAMYEQSVARQLVRTFEVPMNAGKVVQVPVWAAISAQVLTDEEAATAKTTNTTSPTISLKEHVVYNQITDMLRESAYGDVLADLAVQSGQAIGESLDSMVFGEFASFSSDIGSTTTELTTELILRGAATLRSAKVQGPYFAVVHPNAAFHMKKTLTQTLPYSGAPGIAALSAVGNQVQVTGIIGSIGGVTVIESPLVGAVTTGGATAYRGGVFAASAIGLAERGGVQMNSLYLPAARATDMVLKATAGAAVIRATHGVAITAEGVIN
jgi:N4-gp56 family major capsid protein